MRMKNEEKKLNKIKILFCKCFKSSMRIRAIEPRVTHLSFFLLLLYNDCRWTKQDYKANY